jgi:hypothetical protein
MASASRFPAWDLEIFSRFPPPGRHLEKFSHFRPTPPPRIPWGLTLRDFFAFLSNTPAEKTLGFSGTLRFFWLFCPTPPAKKILWTFCFVFLLFVLLFFCFSFFFSGAFRCFLVLFGTFWCFSVGGIVHYFLFLGGFLGL